MYEGFRKYKDATHMRSIRQTRQIVMLYEGMIKLMHNAYLCIEENDIQGRYNYIAKATKIVDGLHASLDTEKGGEVAETLNGFYLSLHYRMMQVNLKNNKKLCQTIMDELRMMKEAWEEVDRVAHTQQAEGGSTKNDSSEQKQSSFPHNDITA